MIQSACRAHSHETTPPSSPNRHLAEQSVGTVPTTLGRHQEALAAGKEAVGLWQAPAGNNPRDIP